MQAGLKFLVTLMFMIFAFGMSVATMINGWGMEVKSWGWVIGGFIGTMILYGLPKALLD